MRLSFIFALLFIFNLSYAEEVSISLSGIEKPLKCERENSINGYFCLNGEKYLIVQDAGNTFWATGELEGAGKLRSYTVDKITSSFSTEDSKKSQNTEDILFQRAPGPFDNMVWNNSEDRIKESESLKKQYMKMAMEISSLENNYIRNRLGEPSLKFKNFIDQKLERLKNEKEKFLKYFESDKRVVELASGEKVNCERLAEKKQKDEYDLKREESTNEPVRCGVYSCGEDKKGNKRLLLSHFSPQDEFTDMLYVTKEGFFNGEKIRRVSAPTSEIPLVDNSKFLDLQKNGASNFYQFSKREISPQAYVPENLKDQSDFFNYVDNSNYNMYLQDTRHHCEGKYNELIDQALESHNKKRTEAEIVQYITLVNEQLESVFLPLSGLPDYACSKNGVYYNPDSYNYQKLNAPSAGAREITLEKAHELFNYAKGMTDIAWNYKPDGCYARAHLMARRFEAIGVHVDKAWLKGDLTAPKSSDDEYQVRWGFHVAPIVYVKGEDGAMEKMVIDPSTFDGPVSLETWTQSLANSSDKTEETSFPFPSNSLTYNRSSIAISNSDPYLPDDNVKMSEEDKNNEAIATMIEYKKY